MVTHSSIVWRIAWTEEHAGYSPWGRKEAGRTQHAPTGHFSSSAQPTCVLSAYCVLDSFTCVHIF